MIVFSQLRKEDIRQIALRLTEQVTKRLAEKFGLPLIELQPVFDELCKVAPADYWVRDGVHPTVSGHEIIKNLWLEAFEKIK